jgi:uncharacterized membrane protein YeaQ/YmgE (transglycosylase-associated protein family)
MVKKTTWVHPKLEALVDKAMRMAMAPVAALGAWVVVGLVTGWLANWVTNAETTPAWYEGIFIDLMILLALFAVWVIGVSMANDVLLRAQGETKG